MKESRVHLIMSDCRQAVQRLFLKRKAVRGGLTLAVAGSLALAWVPAVQAGPSQTQANGTVTANNRQMLAQTFKAVSTGQITRVSLMVGNSAGGWGDIDIQPVVATKPAGPYPGAGQGPGLYNVASNCCSFQNFNLKTPVQLNAGVEYAIVVVPHAGIFTWADYRFVDKYPDGQGWMALQSSNPTWGNLPSGGLDFAFDISPSTGPTIIAGQSSVSVTEGVAPTNSGTFSGNAVTLTATATTGSAGTLTPNSAAGTWSWKGAAADEGHGQTITITATDAQGLTATITFTTVVNSVRPTVSIHSATTGPEGTTVSLTASALSPSAEDNAAGFKYTWSATKNTIGYSGMSGSGAGMTLKIDDEGSYIVSVQATDDGGFVSDPASVAISGTNVQPAATITSVSQLLVVVPGETLTFSGTFSDNPGTLDTHTATWTFGDGASFAPPMIPAGGSTNLSATHKYSTAGTYYVDLTVKDDDGAAGMAGQTIVVLTPAQAMAAIGAYVQSRPGLNAGEKKSLLAKLNAASDSFQRGDSGPACNQMSAFVNEVDAQQRAGHLTSGEATALTGAAGATQLSIGCFRTLVDFLNGL